MSSEINCLISSETLSWTRVILITGRMAQFWIASPAQFSKAPKGKHKPAALLVLCRMGKVVIPTNKVSNTPILLKDSQHRTDLVTTLWKTGEKRLLKHNDDLCELDNLLYANWESP